MADVVQESENSGCGLVGKVPVRNLWLLMLYASDLFRCLDKKNVAIEDNPEEIPDLVAEILVQAVRQRLRSDLSVGYVQREKQLVRVRGRIDMLRTERHQLLARGRVACRFEELTVDTPRNRYVCAALRAISRVARRDLSKACGELARQMIRSGVSITIPARGEHKSAAIGSQAAVDREMLAAAKLALELALPTEQAGSDALPSPSRDIYWIRKLYEKAVGGFYAVTLGAEGWRVKRGKSLTWQIGRTTEGMARILPSMMADIVLESEADARRLVIDTKFNVLLISGWYREESLRSQYLYQIYTYLRSQVSHKDALSLNASGLLLHPSFGEMIDESVEIQGHAIRFATVDLTASAKVIRAQLLTVTEAPFAHIPSESGGGPGASCA